MSTAELDPRPVRVSPVIKFGRWSLLSLGILYGIFHQKRLTKKEAARRAVADKVKAAHDAQLSAEKKRAMEAELQMIEEWSRR